MNPFQVNQVHGHWQVMLHTQPVNLPYANEVEAGALCQALNDAYNIGYQLGYDAGRDAAARQAMIS
jgi:hypothetical protein